MHKIIEEAGLTPEGYRYVIMVSLVMGHRTGYVGVLPDSIFYDSQDDKTEELYNDLYVHGGITYSGFLSRNILGAINHYYIGFDAAHHGDGKISNGAMCTIIDSISEISALEKKQMKDSYTTSIYSVYSSVPAKDLEYIRNACFELSEQLKEKKDNIWQ